MSKMIIISSNMKIRKILSLIIVVAAVSIAGTVAAIAGDNKKASAKFENLSHDFGMIKEDGGPVSCEFPFVNEGGANLIIYEAKAECGCTKPEYPKAPVAPGKSGVIKVTYNPIGRPGGFTKVVTIKTNGNPSKISLKIRGTVAPKSK